MRSDFDHVAVKQKWPGDPAIRSVFVASSRRSTRHELHRLDGVKVLAAAPPRAEAGVLAESAKAATSTINAASILAGMFIANFSSLPFRYALYEEADQEPDIAPRTSDKIDQTPAKVHVGL